MPHIVNDAPSQAERTATRPYRSKLRARHAGDTRNAILDAAVRVAARGIATLTIPDIADEAGISVPTIYRHFPTKQQLLDELYPHLERRAGRGALVVPTTIEELRAGLLRILEQLDSFDDLARAAMASPAAEEARARSMPRRIGLVRAMVDTIEPPLGVESKERVTRLLVVLTSSTSLRTWRDHLAVGAEQVASEIESVVRAVIEAERRGDGR